MRKEKKSEAEKRGEVDTKNRKKEEGYGEVEISGNANDHSPDGSLSLFSFLFSFLCPLSSLLLLDPLGKEGVVFVVSCGGLVPEEKSKKEKEKD